MSKASSSAKAGISGVFLCVDYHCPLGFTVVWKKCQQRTLAGFDVASGLVFDQSGVAVQAKLLLP